MVKSEIYAEDLKYIRRHIRHEIMKDKTVLITGVCGMIGSYIADALLDAEMGIRVIGLDINEERAHNRFFEYYGKGNFTFIKHNISEAFNFETECDYIIHAASNAYPLAFDKDPIGTMLSNFDGIKNLLDFAKGKKTRVLYISSGEIYGEGDGCDFDEQYSGYIDILNPRSCYPSSKRAAETLCVSYLKQYNVDVVIVRPSHIYGLTATESDTRASSQFMREAVAGRNIIMKSNGEQVRSYTYIADCAAAIIYTLQFGECGQAYNISYDKDNVSIKKMAQIIAEVCGVDIIYETASDSETASYNPAARSVLSGDKLRGIGFECSYGIEKGLRRTVDHLRGIGKG